MPVTHELKTLAPYFDAVARGDKNFEVRKDDRSFQAGDTVRLTRITQEYLDREKLPFPASPAPFNPVAPTPITATITYVLRGGQFGIENGYVVLALANVIQKP